jgi:hypothetical protein
MTLKKKIQHLISGQLPEYIKSENPRFLNFLEAYYQFLDGDSGGADLAPNEVLLGLNDWSDIDRTLPDFVYKMRSQYAWDIPESTLVENRRLIKHISDYYEAKGTENSVELFFKLMFDTAVTVRYPGEYVLRASDGRWTQKKIIKLDSSKFMDVINPFDLKNKRIQLRYVDIIAGIGLVLPPPIDTVVSSVSGTNHPHIFKLEVDIDPDTKFYDPNSLIDLRGYFAQDYVEESYVESADIYRTNVDEFIHVWHGDQEYGWLSRQVVGYNIISGGSQFKRGDIFFIDEQGTFGEYFAEDYVINPTDYATNDVNNRVIIRVNTAISDSTGEYVDDIEPYFAEIYTKPIVYGWLQSLDILASGHRFFDRTFNSSVSNFRRGSGFAQVEFYTDYILVLPKKFEGTQGLLSSVNKLQDNYYYQPHSYEVQSPIPRKTWYDMVGRSIHPAGLIAFSDLVIGGEADLSPYLEVEGQVA